MAKKKSIAQRTVDAIKGFNRVSTDLTTSTTSQKSIEKKHGKDSKIACEAKAARERTKKRVEKLKNKFK